MKAFGLWCLFLLIGTAAFMYLGHPRKGSINSNPGTVSVESNAIVKSRKLKNNIDPPIPDYVNLQDYRPINPVPSSKASVRPKPIQHGTPLMPFVPKPSPPPSQPKRGD